MQTIGLNRFRTVISLLLLYVFVISLSALPLTRRTIASPAGKPNPGKSRLAPSVAVQACFE